MSLDRVPAGRNIPDDFNVIIEIPAHADPIKYEVDKETGAVFVDRFIGTAMHYPCNYGYRSWQQWSDLAPERLAQIQHFFEHYKDLEKGKWVKVIGWEGPDSARKDIIDAVAAYQAASPQPAF